jgi:hypothetical protein
MFSTSAPILPVVGLDLFSGHDSFLRDLTEEDESLLVAGSRRSRKSVSKSRSKSRRKSRRKGRRKSRS